MHHVCACLFTGGVEGFLSTVATKTAGSWHDFTVCDAIHGVRRRTVGWRRPDCTQAWNSAFASMASYTLHPLWRRALWMTLVAPMRSFIVWCGVCVRDGGCPTSVMGLITVNVWCMWLWCVCDPFVTHTLNPNPNPNTHFPVQITVSTSWLTEATMHMHGIQLQHQLYLVCDPNGSDTRYSW